MMIIFRKPSLITINLSMFNIKTPDFTEESNLVLRVSMLFSQIITLNESLMSKRLLLLLHFRQKESTLIILQSETP